LYRTVPARSPRPTASSRGASALTFLGCLLVAGAIALLEGLVSVSSGSDWFSRSAQVVWTPPISLARIVWAAVFLLLALAGWRTWRPGVVLTRTGSRGLYVAALVLVALWPPVYLDGYGLLGPTALWLGFTTAFLLDVVLAVLIGTTWRDARAAAVLLVPAAAWILYVTTVNFGDAVLASLA
jgi:tryptophan-rich sensory protein